jgi:hypothetical protein
MNLAAPARPLVATRRRLLLAAGMAALPGWALALPAPAAAVIEVWKSPSCGCCKDWIRHMQANGFRAQVHDEGNTDRRASLGMPLRYASCHTALVGGYAIEGHVPAREVRRLLAQRPRAIGLAVPAMPIGSPGMDGPEYGGRKQAYDVLLVLKDGSASVFQSYT